MVAGLQEIVHLFEITRTRQPWTTGAGKTLRDMERLPAHLVDDVNARGLPLDHHLDRLPKPHDDPKVISLRPFVTAGVRRSA